MAINVFVVDDHELVRRGLVDLIGAEEDLDVVGQAGNIENTSPRCCAGCAIAGWQWNRTLSRDPLVLSRYPPPHAYLILR